MAGTWEAPEPAMTATAVVSNPGSGIAEEELLRARLYGLLARFLAAAPDTALLDAAAALAGDDSELGAALRELARVAATTDESAAAEEYHELFIGLGRGELAPYGSYYLTGFLQEKPLADLRDDLARLGIARRADVPEPEDHIAALCEVMAGLIEGAYGAPADLALQRGFFDAHLAPWADRFFQDLERAGAARLYRPLGRIGRKFFAVETAAFEMAA